MAEKTLPRVNFYDGQQIDEADFDVEQTAWHEGLASLADSLAGSGVELEFATAPVLFDSNSVPASIESLITDGNFDGEPIYPTDSFDNLVFSQPSDSAEGNQLEIEISSADLDGAPTLKVFLFGIAFGGDFVQEVLTFETNESQVTKTYFTSLVSFMTQDFRGNQNIVVTGTPCRDSGGRLRILEVSQMKVVRDEIMIEQINEPNMDYVDFKPAAQSKTLNTLLVEIAATEGLNAADLDINVASVNTRSLPKNDSSGLIVGQKFKATTNNIQKIQILLSVEENTLATPGEEFDWSGDIVVGIRKLQTSTTCPTDIVPGTAIEFDPEPSVLAEVSFNQASLEDAGIVLNDELKVVDFIFTQSLLANPNIEPTIVPGDYYILTVRRSGNVSVGNILLEEVENTSTDPEKRDEMYMSVFSQNKWTDIPDTDMWFRIFTDAIRVTGGSAVDNGVKVHIPKSKENNETGASESFIDGHYSLLDVSKTSTNYIILQKTTEFLDAEPHPSTGNLVFSRMQDAAQISVVSESTLTTLIDSGSKTVVLGAVTDTNPVSNPFIEGTTEFPGLAIGNKFTIIQPTSDILLNNLVGSILTPNTTDTTIKYRITKVELFTDAYGDVNGDGVIDLNDVSRAQIISGFAKDLQSGTVPSVDQIAAIENGTVSMAEIIRADVDATDVIDIFDAQYIQQYILYGTGFDAGATFSRAVLTLENIDNPLSTTVDLLAADPALNAVPFAPIDYTITFMPLWEPSNLIVTDLRRFIPKTFTDISSDDITGDVKSGGSNTSLVPGDILLGGNLLDMAGNSYKVDLEVSTIVINLPEGSTQGELDIFNNFIKNTMYFADGSLVTSSALSDEQVRVSAAIQSIVKDADGYDFESIDGYEAIEEAIAILYTQSSGVLRIRAENIRNVGTRPELSTKIVLTVYLKKAGFRNSEQIITPARVQDLLVPV